MSRYIDADALIDKLPKEYLGSIIHAMINEAPTIEPKQERCEYCKDGDFMGQRQMLGNDGKWHKILFCPNCGAEILWRVSDD